MPAKKNKTAVSKPKPAAAVEPTPPQKPVITEAAHKAEVTKLKARIKELEDMLRQVGFGHKV